jgi:hypothetical protein
MDSFDAACATHVYTAAAIHSLEDMQQHAIIITCKNPSNAIG